MRLTENNIENFIRENKDKFDKYSPQKNHNEHFLMKLTNRFSKIISIIPHLIKVCVVTVLVFVFSFFIWKTYIAPPLTRTSLKYYKIEHLYKYKINKDNRLLLTTYIKDSIEI